MLTQDEAQELLYDVSPRDMEERADSMAPEDRRRLASHLESMATSAVWRSVYLDARYGHGCGDQGHGAAVKKANKVLVGLRKVLGYTYPERGAIHV
jgi:hypothetical protein